MGRLSAGQIDAAIGASTFHLVPFGKHVCTGKLPRCSTCPVLDMCRQVGVAAHR
jgi:endonuclease III